MAGPLALPSKQLSNATLQQGTSFLKEDLQMVLASNVSMEDKLEASHQHQFGIFLGFYRTCPNYRFSEAARKRMASLTASATPALPAPKSKPIPTPARAKSLEDIPVVCSPC